MKRLMLIGLIICLAVVVGCHSRTNVPKAGKEAQKEATKEEKKTQKEDKRVEKESLPAAVPAGKNLKISVLMDTGGDEFKTDQREQVNDFMGKDLVKMLDKAGYEASLISDRSQYIKGTYLLKVTIIKYNPGSKALRYGVGFGAGSVSLDTRYELFTPGGKLLVSDEHGVGSSLDWTSCARKLNKQTVDAVKDKLGR